MNNIAYRWTVSPDSGYIKLIVVREPQTGQRLTAIFPYRLIIPSLVRSVILLVLEQGWQPTKQGLKEFYIFDAEKQFPVLKLSENICSKFL